MVRSEEARFGFRKLADQVKASHVAQSIAGGWTLAAWTSGPDSAAADEDRGDDEQKPARDHRKATGRCGHGNAVSDEMDEGEIATEDHGAERDGRGRDAHQRAATSEQRQREDGGRLGESYQRKRAEDG